jgi:hypothetical protein
MDLIYIGIVILFFAATFALIALAGSLQRGAQ